MKTWIKLIKGINLKVITVASLIWHMAVTSDAGA
jgi:hypothetical protein